MINYDEIVRRIRTIILYGNEILDSNGKLDYVMNHTRMISELTELMLDIIYNSDEK